MEIKCDISEDDAYGNILVLFWVLFTLWIVLTPLSFLTLLAYIRPSVQSKSITKLADSCRFLWQDYDPSMIYWDVIDTLRKIFLTGFIMLIDRREGSNKMLRLVIASTVSILYICTLLAFHPYERQDDYNLAFLSNFFLICCFLMGIILKHCGEDDDSGGDNTDNVSFCSRFIGDYFDSYRATLMVVLLTFNMLFLSNIFVVVLAIKKFREPIVYMASTGFPPILELPEECSYHMFMSHVWGTGQAQTHAIVRKLQLFMPGLKVWLDIDELTDITNLEESVSKSASFVIYYSRGYFRSRNCQRELYAAIILDKPMIVIYKGDREVLVEEMIEECKSNCNGYDSPGSSVILDRIFGDSKYSLAAPTIDKGPIEWLDGAGFSPASLDLIYNRVLRSLPYYKNHPNELSSSSTMVPGELGPVALLSPINILVCDSNYGCLEVAKELKGIVSDRNSENIFIHDAAEYLNIRDERKVFEMEDEYTRDWLMSQPNGNDGPTFLLLYLNKFIFHEKNSQMEMIIESCINSPNIHLVLVHEKDILKGWCKFDDFFKMTPQKLINEPCNLYAEMAIPLYSRKEYRDVSLKMILNKMRVTQSRRGSMRGSTKERIQSLTRLIGSRR